MVLAVEARDLHVDDRVAVEATGRHRLLDALLHRGDELPRDRSADDGVDVLEALAVGQRLDAQHATPNWPWPPDCFLYLPSASACCVMVSR